jgi:hypothetical protein
MRGIKGVSQSRLEHKITRLCVSPYQLEMRFRPDTPLRLSVAAPLAFPDGSMTALGLLRVATRNTAG